MKHAIRAVVALALGVGMAAAAQAAGTYSQSAASPPKMDAAAPAKMQHARTTAQTSQAKMVRQTQQRMKAQGFYKGPIDGKWTAQTKRAFAQFQKKNQLARTAKLNRTTAAQMKSSRVAGVGSSMPRHANAFGKTKVVKQKQATPAATQAPSAGGSTPPANQNMQR